MNDSAEARLDDIIASAARTGRTGYTLFLDPAAARCFEGRTRKAGLVFCCNGGYEGAERVVCAAAVSDECQIELQPVVIRWDKRHWDIAHHDVLGAVIGCGLARDRFGDVIVGDGEAYVVMLPASARILASQLASVGRAPVTVQECPCVQLVPDEGTQVKASFATPRLDAVIAEAMRLSRGDAAALVDSGRVSLNYAECTRRDARVRENDVISVRGKGRIVMGAEGGVSKKGRTYYTMTVFLRERRGRS